VWTGKELVIWGGKGPNQQPLADGGAYDPSAGTWRTIAASPLAPRSGRPVWTGKEMLVWGGQAAGSDYRVDGAAYDPATDHWRMIAASPLAGRVLSATAWTGTELLVWGGQHGDSTAPDYLADGAAYNPTTDTWRPMAKAPLSPRSTTGFWTGKEFLVWGGEGPNAAFVDGAAYDPAADTWRPIPRAPLVARRGFAAVWTGTDMLIWGGAAASGPSFYGNGALYDPAAGRWRRMKPGSPRFIPDTAWTGSSLLVWGGLVVGATAVEPAIDGALFTP
jgi:N-acetylneuraminic acid mutarotase